MKNKIKMCQRLLCVALTLVMLLTVLPVQQAAAKDIFGDPETYLLRDDVAGVWSFGASTKWRLSTNKGEIYAPTSNSLYYLNKTNGYAMTDYTFQADITLPEDAAVSTTKLGGIAFGIQDGNDCTTSRYEFTVTHNGTGWCTRVYKRTDAAGETSYKLLGDHGGVNAGADAQITAGEPFTMKVVVSGLNIKFYINDTQLYQQYTVSSESDANTTRGAVTGGVGLIGFAGAQATFTNVKLTDTAYQIDETNATVWESAATSTFAFNAITGEVEAPTNNTVLYANKATSYEQSDYVFQTDITLPANGTLGGIAFGIQDGNGCTTSRYEFTVSAVTDSDTGDLLGWGTRIYKRVAGSDGESAYACVGGTADQKTVNPAVNIAVGKSFKMKVELDGLNAKCYIDNTLIYDFTVNSSKDANTARGAITGGVGLIGFGGTNAVFDNMQVYTRDVIGYSESFDEGKTYGQVQNAYGWSGFDANWTVNGEAYYNGTLTAAQITEAGSKPTSRPNASDKVYLKNFTTATALGQEKGTLSDYTFEATITPVSAYYNSTDAVAVDSYDFPFTNYGGIYVGCDASNAGYEFTVVSADGGATWKYRLYDRINKVSIVETAVPEGISLAMDDAFTMKAELYGAKINFYIDGAKVYTHISDSTVTGFPAIATFACATIFDDIKLTFHDPVTTTYMDVKDENNAIALHGVSYDETEQVFNRMDLAVAEQIAGGTDFSKTSVYSHARESAGGRIRFSTDSSYVSIKATLDYQDITYAGAMGDGQFGFDVYVDTAEGSTYAGTVAAEKPTEAGEVTVEGTVNLGNASNYNLTIYFPLTIEVKDVQIGVESIATVAEHGIAYAADEHIVYYGSSITQGGVAKKPGNSFVNIVGRNLNVDYTNLGVWGSAQGQNLFAQYIAGIADMTVFVFDYDHNTNDPESLSKNHYPFYETVRAAHPDIPIIFISRPGNAVGEETTEQLKSVIRASYNKAVAAGDTNVHFIDGEEFFGYSTDYLAGDKIHPNDAGHAAMAELVTSVLTRVLDGEKNVYVGEVVEASASIERWNLSLGDDIGVNFYVSLSDAASTVVSITVGDQTTSVNASTVTPENGYYAFSVNVAAAQMTEEILVKIQCSDVTVEETYSVYQYAQYILADEKDEFDEKTEALVKEMLNYGNAAQSYFGYNTENTIDENLIAGAGTAQIDTSNVPDMSISGTIDGIRFYGASLLFKSKTAVRFYFDADSSINDCSFMVGEKTYTHVLKESDGLYYVEINDIAPQSLNESITLDVVCGDQSICVTYGPMNYMERMSEKGSEDLQLLLKAMYNYHLAAINYTAVETA